MRVLSEIVRSLGIVAKDEYILAYWVQVGKFFSRAGRDFYEKLRYRAKIP